MVKVLIVDDHPIVRSGLAGEIAKTSDITVIAEASDGDSAIEKVRACAPDIVLLDIALPGKNGFEVLKQLPCRGATSQSSNVERIL